MPLVINVAKASALYAAQILLVRQLFCVALVVIIVARKKTEGNPMLMDILYYGGMAYLMISFFAMFFILGINIITGDVKDQAPLWYALLWPCIFF
jgi:hypothetical protein